MSRERAEHVAQGTWRSGSLHVWGWNGESTASAAWLYGGFGHNRWSGAENGWHDTPASYGELARIELELPSGRRSVRPERPARSRTARRSGCPTRPAATSCRRRWRGSPRSPASPSPIVTGGRLTPTVARGGTVHRRPLDSRARRRDRADARRCSTTRAPPICRNGTRATAGRHARRAGRRAGPRRSSTRRLEARSRPQRSAQVQALRAVFTSLARADAVVRGGTDRVRQRELELGRAGCCDRHGERLAGEPVFAPRLRLTMPEDAGDPVGGHARALRRARPRPMVHRRRRVERVRRRPRPRSATSATSRGSELLVATSPAPWPSTSPASPIWPPSTSRAGSSSTSTPPTTSSTSPRTSWRRLGIELIGPEHLVRAKVGVRGRATPAPVDDRRKRFGVEALVDWSAVIDDTPISDVELARVEAAGARAAAHREPMGPHRPGRAAPGAHRARASTVASTRRSTRVALLRLASGDDDDGDTALERRSTDEAVDERLDGTDGLGRRPPRRAPRRAARGGARGRHASRASCATTSVAAWRGCSSSPGSASAAASPTTWGSARPPPRSPTSSSGRGRTSWCAR